MLVLKNGRYKNVFYQDIFSKPTNSNDIAYSLSIWINNFEDISSKRIVVISADICFKVGRV